MATSNDTHTANSLQINDYAIFTAINEWERHSIGKIQCAARQARDDLSRLFDNKRQDFVQLLTQIGVSSSTNINLTQLTDELNKLRRDLSTLSSTIHLEHNKKDAPIYLIRFSPKNNDRLDDDVDEENISVPGTELLTLARLQTMTADERKHCLGERLFVLVQQMEPHFAAKITGMFLEFDIKSILILIKSPQVLKEKIREALKVLQVHQYRQRHVIES